ncbi:GIY-YIG nuclease family protein [Porticoccaceae bacterium LTM1]|nr:GIY-YIG nuclease family protein [Porticoccaceae bacterium LTM1]
MSEWSLYLVRYAGNRLYTGITTDVERRFGEHCDGEKGAKALKGKGPLKLVFNQVVGNRSVATRLEMSVKKLSKQQKEALVTGRLSLSKLIEKYIGEQRD